MLGRAGQSLSRSAGLRKRRLSMLAERVANGAAVHDAGKTMGLSKGETARAWSNIKRELGGQAC